MKKNLRVIFGVLLIIISIFSLTGCFSRKELKYEGDKFDITFNVKAYNRYTISKDSDARTTIEEKKVLLGDGFKIGIEEDLSVSYSENNGDFTKYAEGFKNEPEYLEVTYSGIKGFQKYYKPYNRYEIFLPLDNNDKVSIKLNVYSDKNTKEDLKNIFNSEDVQDILNNIVVTSK